MLSESPSCLLFVSKCALVLSAQARRRKLDFGKAVDVPQRPFLPPPSQPESALPFPSSAGGLSPRRFPFPSLAPQHLELRGRGKGYSGAALLYYTAYSQSDYAVALAPFTERGFSYPSPRAALLHTRLSLGCPRLSKCPFVRARRLLRPRSLGRDISWHSAHPCGPSPLFSPTSSLASLCFSRLDESHKKGERESSPLRQVSVEVPNICDLSFLKWNST